MSETFVTELNIHHVRHLRNIDIPLSADARKNLILTGKNGSGKTSVLKAIVLFLQNIILEISNDSFQKRMIDYYTSLNNQGCSVSWTSVAELQEKYAQGKYVLAYFGDSRKINVDISDTIEKVNLKKTYRIDERPNKELVKYLVNLKTTQAFAQAKGDVNKAQEIEQWFMRFESVLQKVYDEPSLYLDFDIETFQFRICIENREPFEFNSMSMGYAAVFDIIGDLVMRMEAAKDYNLEGLVLIDEIETHLHVELQRKIVPILVELFPKLQFILTTHSPFVLSSDPNAAIYDLERHVLVKDGLANLPYSGIVEGYFEVDSLSIDLANKFAEYKELLMKSQKVPNDLVRMRQLEMYLDEIPDYLAIDFAEEYERLKLEYK